MIDMELYDLLIRLQEYMDDRADSVDDFSGNPTANVEMRLSQEIEVMIKQLEQL